MHNCCINNYYIIFVCLFVIVRVCHLYCIAVIVIVIVIAIVAVVVVLAVVVVIVITSNCVPACR